MTRNVCALVDPPRIAGKEITPLDPEQSRALLDAARGDRYEALCTVALACGLREGELLGLITPLDASNLVNRHFKPLLRRTDLPPIRFHDLRHTCATLLLLKGVHPKFVQNLLGHRSIKITLDLYSHWMPDMGDFTADTLEIILWPRTDLFSRTKRRNLTPTAAPLLPRGPVFDRAPQILAAFPLQNAEKEESRRADSNR